jgi:hypothetical protein
VRDAQVLEVLDVPEDRPASLTAGIPAIRRPPADSHTLFRRYGKTMPASETTMNATICASSAPSKLALAFTVSRTRATSSVIVAKTIAFTGVWYRSLTSPA